jgi:hypothetical protein
MSHRRRRRLAAASCHRQSSVSAAASALLPWGINLYPDVPGADWVEFDSVINLRPSSGSCSRGADDPATRKVIVRLVERLVRR